MRFMDTTKLEKHFGTKALAMRAVGCKSRQLWRAWTINGIPHGKQCEIQLLTDGKLKADGLASAEKIAAA